MHVSRKTATTENLGSSSTIRIILTVRRKEKRGIDLLLLIHVIFAAFTFLRSFLGHEPICFSMRITLPPCLGEKFKLLKYYYKQMFIEP